MADHSDVPLTAEQIVRGLGFALAQIVNAQRHPSEAIRADALTLDLGAFMGVPLTTEEQPYASEWHLPTGQRHAQTILAVTPRGAKEIDPLNAHKAFGEGAGR